MSATEHLDAALVALSRHVDALEAIARRLDADVAGGELEPIHAGLSARERSLAGVGELLDRVSLDALRTRPGGAAVVERLERLWHHGESLSEALTRRVTATREALSDTTVRHSFATHQASIRGRTTGGWCDVRR